MWPGAFRGLSSSWLPRICVGFCGSSGSIGGRRIANHGPVSFGAFFALSNSFASKLMNAMNSSAFVMAIAV
jgi:hypothetical protein